MIRALLSAVLVAGSLVTAAVAAPPSMASRCAAFGEADAARWGGKLAITVDEAPDALWIDRYEGRVGTTDVPTVLHGRAMVDDGGGPRRRRFICLDGGDPEPGPVFFYLLPDELPPR